MTDNQQRLGEAMRAMSEDEISEMQIRQAAGMQNDYGKWRREMEAMNQEFYAKLARKHVDDLDAMTKPTFRGDVLLAIVVAFIVGAVVYFLCAKIGMQSPVVPVSGALAEATK